MSALQDQKAQIDESLRLLRRLRTSNQLALRTQDPRFYKSSIEDAHTLLSLDTNLDNKALAAECGLTAVSGLLSGMAERVASEMKQVWEQVTSELDTETPSETRAVTTRALEGLKLHSLEIAQCKAFALEVVKQAGEQGAADRPSPLVALSVLAPVLVDQAGDLQRSIALKSASVHKVRMLLHPLPPAVRQVFNAVRAITEEIGRLDTALDAVGDGPGAYEAKARHARVIELLLDRVEKAGDRFAEVAAENWSDEGDGPQRWMHTLEYAQTLGSFSDAFRTLVERYPAPPLAAEPVEPVEDAPVAEARLANSEATTSQGGVQAAAAPRKTTAPAQAAAASTLPADLSHALDRAQHLLRASRKLSLDMVAEAGGDPVQLAHAIGKDTSGVEAMIADGHDPMSVATMLRSSIQGWFGDVDRLRTVRAQIGSLQGKHAAEVEGPVARLDERIAALEAVHAHILAGEVAALKSLERPKDKHVERLLALGEIRTVSQPTRLPSEGDTEGLGTLFELAIQPRPLPDGRVPDPIFLHLHTREPVSESACLALSHDAFAAAHVKNARQKNLGPRWEQMQSSRENADARRVHRGPVSEPLWKKLRELVD